MLRHEPQSSQAIPALSRLNLCGGRCVSVWELNAIVKSENHHIKPDLAGAANKSTIGGFQKMFDDFPTERTFLDWTGNQIRKAGVRESVSFFRATGSKTVSYSRVLLSYSDVGPHRGIPEHWNSIAAGPLETLRHDVADHYRDTSHPADSYAAEARERASRQRRDPH